MNFHYLHVLRTIDKSNLSPEYRLKQEYQFLADHCDARKRKYEAQYKYLLTLLDEVMEWNESSRQEQVNRICEAMFLMDEDFPDEDEEKDLSPYQKLYSLMEEASITEDQLRKVVAAEDLCPAVVPIRSYPESFVKGYCIKHFSDIVAAVRKNQEEHGD